MVTPLWVIAVCAVLFTARMLHEEFWGWVEVKYRYRTVDMPQWIRRVGQWLT